MHFTSMTYTEVHVCINFKSKQAADPNCLRPQKHMLDLQIPIAATSPVNGCIYKSEVNREVSREIAYYGI